MPRPKTKAELIDAANVQWSKMWSIIDAMPEGRRLASFSFGEDLKRKEAHWTRDRNLRDVLTHLLEWHRLLLDWSAANLGGETRPFLPAPYNWKTYGDMNMAFWQKHQSTPYEDAKAALRVTHGRVMTSIEAFTEEELFEKGHFPWTGTANLGSYCVSVTASHYDWAIRKIKLHDKTCAAG